MDKLDMHTKDISQENVEKIRRLFPNCVTETKENGKIVSKVDFDTLRQELLDSVIDAGKERYQMTWPGKRESILLANSPTTSTLRPDVDGSVDFENTENLYIEGDNLEVLKNLRETYLGKIKMIYIDPPYNTGNDFIYNDDFKESSGEYLKKSGEIDEIGNRLTINSKTNGRYHSDWLSMINPRVRLAKDLLSEDGVIFISIDDKEIANLKAICDETFGENNFVADMIWQSRTSISNDYEVSLNHNHTLVYSKDRISLIFGGDDISREDYINPDNDPRGPWKLVPIDANHIGGDTIYPITNPKTGQDYYPPNGRIWCYNKETMAKLISEGRIKFGLNDDSAPKRKLYYNERIEKGDKKTPSSLVLDAGTTKDGTSSIMNLFNGKKLFDYPKSVEFIIRLCKYGSLKDSIILDFFSGSATTADAVMQLNAEDGGKRKFIMVQLPELCGEKSEAFKAGYRNICEIGKERIKRAGRKVKEESPLTTQNLDIGFRVLKLDSSNMEDVYYSPSKITTQSLLTLGSNIKEGRGPLDLLFQIMLELGLTLSKKIEKRNIKGRDVYFVGDNDLAACFDRDVDDSVCEKIAKMTPLYACFRDDSFLNDAAKVNCEQIFKTLSPSTKVKVI